MLVEAGGGRGRRLLLFSPPIKAAAKIGVWGGAGGRVGVLRGIESYTPRLQEIHVHKKWMFKSSPKADFPFPQKISGRAAYAHM